ncbi:MAG: methylmalonyl-CoA mutase family protein, partial [Chitinophagales bacterium]
EALAAALGGTQSLHTNSLDEAIALPTDFSARIARNTQIYLQQETNICKTVDPWGGSNIVEALTEKIIEDAWKLIEEVEKLGGMQKAIEAGIPKMRIEEAAAKKQGRIDSATDIIVGLNAFIKDEKSNFEILEVDNSAVRDAQIERINQVKANRNNNEVEQILNKITECAEQGNGNLLALAVEAARKRATLGEISFAMEKIFGRYTANIQSVSGVYQKEVMDNESFTTARALSDTFAEKEGRRPRILIAKLGQDGHDRGAKVIASAFADIGFDVDISPLFLTPAEAVKQAIENDVHVIGISSLAAGHKTLVPQVIDLLKEQGRGDILVVVGGVIPQQDYEFLYSAGTSFIFGPGTVISIAAIDLLNKLLHNNTEE